MNNVTRILSVSTLALALASEAAYADPGKTRGQAQAELAAAQRAGDIIIGEQGLSLRELSPSQYPPVATRPGKTCRQVQAELAAAQKAGNIIVGEQGVSLRELFPSQYPPVATGPGKTREMAKAELVAAQQNGDIVTSFAAKTERELFPERFEYSTMAASPGYAARNDGAVSTN